MIRVHKKTLRTLLFFPIFVLVIVALFRFMPSSPEKDMGQDVGVDVPALFPVLVVTSAEGKGPYTARVVFHKELAEVLKKNSAYTYLVPEGQEQNFQEQLRSSSQLPDHARSRIHLKVDRRPDGKQLLMVSYPPHEEAAAVGWYEASDKDIFPRRFRSGHDMVQFVAMFPYIGVALIGGYLLASLISWFAKKRWPDYVQD